MLVFTRRDLQAKAHAPAFRTGWAPGESRLAGVARHPQAPTQCGKVPQMQALLPLFQAVRRPGLERHGGGSGRAALHALKAAP